MCMVFLSRSSPVYRVFIEADINILRMLISCVLVVAVSNSNHIRASRGVTLYRALVPISLDDNQSTVRTNAQATCLKTSLCTLALNGLTWTIN